MVPPYNSAPPNLGNAPVTPARSSGKVSILAPKQTPYLAKLASNPGKKILIHKSMDPLLRNELREAELADVPGLVEHMFPDSCLPMPPVDILSALAAISESQPPLYTNSKWVGCPDLSVPSTKGDVERKLAAFFETVTKRVSQILVDAGKEMPASRRSWTGDFSSGAAVADAPNVRYPDLFCRDGDDEDDEDDDVKSRGWRAALSHAEVKSNINAKRGSYVQLMNGAYLAFSVQDDRRFFVSLSIVADNFRLVIFDRSGLTISKPFNIHGDPELFLRVFVGLAFCKDRARLGYDTTIVTKDGRRFVEVEGRSYELVKPVFISDVIRGRGTVCWHATCDGQDYVIKDTWADTSRTNTEAEILRLAAAARVAGVPVVVAETIVQIHGRDDSTENIRSTIVSGKGKLFKAASALEKRLHRRVVVTPYALPLTWFESKKELISIFIDAVTAHQQLIEANILHRDISLNNIMMTPNQSSPISLTPSPESGDATVNQPVAAVPKLRRGLLIDMDYALVLDPANPRTACSVSHRTGTLPFMAVDILMWGDTDAVHEPKHDLESLLYILIWICFHYAGPRNVERKNFSIADSPLSDWVEGATFAQVGKLKLSFQTDKVWVREFVPQLAPYFTSLEPCISAWRSLLVREQLTHDSVLAVLRDAFSSHEEVEIWSQQSDPAGYGIGMNRKRSLRQIREDDMEEEEDEKVDDDEDDEAAVNEQTPAVVSPTPAFHSAPPRLIDRMKPRQPKRQKSSE